MQYRALMLRLQILLYNDPIFGGGIPRRPETIPRPTEDLAIRIYAEGRCYLLRMEEVEE